MDSIGEITNELLSSKFCYIEEVGEREVKNKKSLFITRNKNSTEHNSILKDQLTGFLRKMYIAELFLPCGKFVCHTRYQKTILELEYDINHSSDSEIIMFFLVNSDASK